MRQLLLLVVLLTATSNVSAQDVLPFGSAHPIRHTTVYIDPSAYEPVYPWQEATGVRLWAPCQHGHWHWWSQVRIHRGPGWETVAGRHIYADDRVVEHWVADPTPAPQGASKGMQQSVQTKEQRAGATPYRTIDVWSLREKAFSERSSEVREAQEQGLRDSSRFFEPVYRVPHTGSPHAESSKLPSEAKEKPSDGWRPRSQPKEEKPSTAPRSQSRGPTMLCEVRSTLN